MKISAILSTTNLVLCLLLSSLLSHTAQAKNQLITMQTEQGDIKIELYSDKAPISSANFLRYIKAGGFKGGEFYRVVRLDNDNGEPKIEVIQGGANPEFKDFPAIKLETTQTTGIRHLDGTLSMARAEPDTATSAFFICIGAQPSLDFGGTRNKDGQGFAAFGRVVEGMDVVKQIHQIQDTVTTDEAYTQGQILQHPVKIKDVTF
ncbi:peptidylprolyl isomerase [Neptunicella sp. SCSIO 80796]|uniref:peptidylprolyl isomerase n=1 Tax=Neptunicella plasticusilytica TaxID=3117012 RepID=UPI003A4DE436